MPSAEIITIGTEILLGEIVDTNTRFIAHCLRVNGIDIYRTSSIGDNIERIAEAVREAMSRADIVITTGGLGPTVDDPTRDAIALAFGVKTEFRETLWQQVIDRFARFDSIPGENNRHQAYVPQGAIAIENPVGTAPAFMMEAGGSVVFALPGVPGEMKHLLTNDVLPVIRERFPSKHVLLVRLLHTTGAGESRIDARIADLEELTNPTVGLAAHAGQVDVRITAKAPDIEQARALIDPVEAEIRERLGNWVFGADDDTLGTIAMQALRARGWTLGIVEAGLGGSLLSTLPHGDSPFVQGWMIPCAPETPAELLRLTESCRKELSVDVALGVSLLPGERAEIDLAWVTPTTTKTRMFPYGGPPSLAPLRAANLALDLLRRF